MSWCGMVGEAMAAARCLSVGWWRGWSVDSRCWATVAWFHVPAVLSLAMLLVLNRAAFGQDPPELVQLWEIDPPLNAFRQESPIKPHLPNMRQLASASPEYQVAEARRLLVTQLLVSDEEAAEVVAVAMETLRSKTAVRDLRLVMASVVLMYSKGEEFAELWNLAMDEPTLRRAVELGLAQRNHLAPQDFWVQRLSAPHTAAVADLDIAIKGLGSADFGDVGELLLEVLHDDRLQYVTRLEAARGLAGHKQGLESHATRLLGGSLPAKEQLAAELLAQHDSAETERVMQQLLVGSFRPAQVVAFRWIREHRPSLAIELSLEHIEHPDSNMRLEVAAALDHDDSPESLRRQGTLLADRSMTVRRTVREQLIEKWKSPELATVVNEILDGYLRNDDVYEGQEQAIMVAVAINGRERVPRLIELLDHPRQEVAITAAWGLQQLAHQPSDLAVILQYCQRWTDRLENDKPDLPVANTDVFRLAFLFQALGRNQYMPADSMLRQYVPKREQKMRANTRAAAIWALGEIWRGSLDSRLEDALMERLMDMDPIYPEELHVQYTSAIAIGKFGNPRSLPGLQSAPYQASSPLGIAVRWCIDRIGRE
jgi:hypothetical protein